MSSSSIGRHASGGATTDQLSVPEPSFAERARTLMYLGRVGSLSTLSRKRSGFPFGSVMPYVMDERGRPIFLISTMATHTQNLLADPRASLLVTQPDSGDPLGDSRVTLLGDVSAIDQAEIAGMRELYLARYENSKHWVDYEDFSFYRMSIIDVYYVGGFGVMGWVTASEYELATPDPLADVSAGIIQHMNADHKDALILLAKTHSGIEAHDAAMTSVDRLGFHVRLTTQDRVRGVRIGFPREVRTAEETRKAVVEMVQRARADSEHARK
jgi:putative heme iron utilization protein